MEGYNSEIDYKNLHLEFIKANPRFRPKCGLLDRYQSYLEQMQAMYYGNDATIKLNTTAFLYLRDDYKWKKSGMKDINEKIALMFGDNPEQKDPVFFITFNFDNSKWDANKAINAVNKLFEKSWITSAYGVFEYYGSQQNHPHLMMKLVVNKYGKLGKLKDKLKETSLCTQLMSGINFLDIKLFQSYHNDYMQLDKSLEKKEQLDKDIVWRKVQGLPEFVEKKVENI
jgi:hypothetical protein